MTRKAKALAQDGTPASVNERPGRVPPERVLLTVPQIEQKHPALKGRMRTWIHRADCGDPEFAGLRIALVRIGRSVFISDEYFRRFIENNRAMSPAPSRNDGAAQTTP